MIRDDFDIVNYTSDVERLTCLHWTGLSRQEISHLRNLSHSDALSAFVRPYGCGIGSGSQVDLMSEEDPNSAEFDLMISSDDDLAPALLGDIIDFVKRYRIP
ncbi:hypothetical protein GCM10027085_18040 [Spirosoma aerophilum]